MPTPSATDIRRRLNAFAKDWAHAHGEAADAKTFWLRFYECFGICAESAIFYKKAVDKLSSARGFIDSFIPGKLIVEHKSRCKDLRTPGSYLASLRTPSLAFQPQHLLPLP